jgi:PAS domain S-box-containing protein
VQDITERKIALEELQLKAQLLDAATDAIIMRSFDDGPKARILYVNEAATKTFGYTHDELLKMSVRELYPWSSPELTETRRKHLEEAGENYFELFSRCKDGTRMPVENHTKLVTIGGRRFALSVVRDITERKKAEWALSESEAKFRNLVENAPVGISISTLEGQALFRNQAFAELYGFKDVAEYMVNTGTVRYCNPEDRKSFLELVGKGIVKNFEVHLKHKDGTPFWASFNAIPQITGTGEKQFINIVQDIKERKQAEEELKASEAKYRIMVENLPVGVSLNTFDGRNPERNRAYVEMHGYTSEEEFEKVTALETYFDPEDRKRFFNKMGEGAVRNFEVKHKRKDGSQFWVSLSAIPQIGMHGEKQSLVICHDIDERKQAEEALKASEERFRSLIENLPVGIGVSTEDGCSGQRNRALMEIYGYTDRQEFNASSILGRYDDVKDRARFVELAETGPVKDFEVRLKRKDGTIFWASMNAIKNAAPSGEKQFITVIQDIDAKKKVDEENELKAMLLDSAADMIYVQDLTGKIIYANDATCKSHGFTKDEITTMNIRDLLLPEQVGMVSARTDKVLAEGELRFETIHSCKDGSKIPMEVYNRLIKMGDAQAIISVGRDISERKQLEQQLILTDRLASIGQLASGVAHEVNNPLTSVIGFTELLLERPLDDDIKEDLTTIRDEAQRAAGVVRNLLTFARKQTVAKQEVNLNDIIQKVLLLRTYEESLNNIKIINRLSPALNPVMADASQLQQVFFNIITNAEYFMIETHHKGTFTIITENIGNIVRASIADDGPGMSADDLSHLFTPFFSTKPVGKGTGLGLSICHGIITAHEGRMYAESVPGKGATFIVELPATGNQPNRKEEVENGES